MTTFASRRMNILCIKLKIRSKRNIKRKPKGQSRMDTPETLATLGTQDREHRKIIRHVTHIAKTTTYDFGNTCPSLGIHVLA